MNIVTQTKTQFTPETIILWHVRAIPVPGVVMEANDENRTAIIKVRNLRGDIQTLTVAYSEIEVRP